MDVYLITVMNFTHADTVMRLNCGYYRTIVARTHEIIFPENSLVGWSAKLNHQTTSRTLLGLNPHDTNSRFKF